MSSDETTDQSIERLLRLLEQGATSSNEAKDAARVRMREAFIAARLDENEVAESVGEIELLRVVAEDPPRHSSRRLRYSFAAAAAILLIGVVGLLAVASRSTPSIDTTAQDGRLIAEGTGPLPAQLPIGSYTTTALGTAMTFDVDKPIWLVAEDPGWIELAVDPDDPSSRLVLTRPTDAPAQLGSSMIEWVNAAEAVSFQRSRTTVGGQPTNVWTIFVSDQAIADGNCQIGDGCVRLFANPGDVELRAGGVNDVLEIEQGPHEPIYVVTWRSPQVSQVELGGYDTLADSITFGDLRPSPLN